MGQAKARGTFEQRKVEAEVKAKVLAEELEIARKLKESKMTPEEKQERHKGRMLLASLLGMGIISGYEGLK